MCAAFVLLFTAYMLALEHVWRLLVLFRATVTEKGCRGCLG